MPLLAQPTPTVQEVVVSRLAPPSPAGEAAYAVAAISPERLQGATELDQALKGSAGFSLFRRTSTLGANPTTQGASLRAVAGSGASRALVTLDGVPQNDPFGGWVIWTALPPVTIDSARIVRGAGSGPYGAGALTGVVALDSTAWPRPVTDTLEVSAGELGYARADLLAGAEFGGSGGGIVVNASGQRSDGWTPVRYQAGPADRRLTLDAFTASVTGVADLPGASVAVRVAGYEESRGSGLVGANSASSGAQGSVTLASRPGAEGPGWRLQGWVTGSDLYNTSVATSLDRRTTTPANTQFQTPALGWGLNAAVRRAAGHFSVELGADVRGADGESRERFTFAGGGFTRGRVAGGEVLVAGAYLEAAWRPSPWLVTGGVRLDRWSQSDARRIETTLATGAVTLDSRAADRDGVLPTGRAGVRRELGGGLALRAAGYAGFRPATLNELHRPFRVGNNLTEANPELDPERLYGVEGGLSFARGTTTADLTVFHNRLEDAITNVTVGFGPGTFPVAGFVPAGGILRQRRNAGAVDATGLEVEAARTLFAERLRLETSLAWTDSEVDGGSTAPQLTGKRPALTPEVTLTAGATWRVADRLRVSGFLRYEGLRYEDDLNTLRLDPAVTVDLRADWTVRKGVAFFLAADNLFDEDVQTQRSADGIVSYDAPRLLRAGLRLTR